MSTNGVMRQLHYLLVGAAVSHWPPQPCCHSCPAGLQISTSHDRPYEAGKETSSPAQTVHRDRLHWWAAYLPKWNGKSQTSHISCLRVLGMQCILQQWLLVPAAVAEFLVPVQQRQPATFLSLFSSGEPMFGNNPQPPQGHAPAPAPRLGHVSLSTLGRL